MMEKRAPMRMIEKCGLSEYQSEFDKMANSVKEKLTTKPDDAPVAPAPAITYYKQPSFDFMKNKGTGK